MSEEDFDAAVGKLSAVIPQLTDMQVIVEMRKLLRLLGDGHVLHRLIGCRKVNRRGRLFVIIGRATFSAAQNGATMIERHTEAIFVGEPTGSSPTLWARPSPSRYPIASWRRMSPISTGRPPGRWTIGAGSRRSSTRRRPSRRSGRTAIRRWRRFSPAASIFLAGSR